MNFTPTRLQQVNSYFEGKDVVVRFTMKNGNKVSNTAMDTVGIIPGEYNRQSNNPPAATEKQNTLLKFSFKNTATGFCWLK